MQSLRAKTTAKVSYSLITTILFWCGLVIVASNYLTIPLMSTFQEAFKVNAANVAWTGSAFSLCYAIGSLFSGPLSDRYGRKQVILTGLFILTLITFAIPLYRSLTWIIVLRSIQGFSAASFAPVAIAYVVDHFPYRKVVTTIGFISSGFLISGIVGQVFSSFLNQHYGWKSVFYYSGFIYLLTAILVLLLLPKTNSSPADNNSMGMLRQFQTILSDKRLISAYIITITLLLTFVAFYTVLGDYLSESFKLDEDGILLVRMIGILGMLIAPFAGILTNKYGIIPILRCGLVLAGFGGVIVGMSTNLLFLIMMSVVFVTGIAITVPTLISLVGHLGGKNHGAAVSLYAFILFIGTSLGPIVSVFLLQIGNYAIAFGLLALLLFISLVTSFFITLNQRS